MSIFPWMSTHENYGLFEVHLIRQVYLAEEEFIAVRSLAPSVTRQTTTSPVANQLVIEFVIEDILADLNEIERT